MAVFNFEDGSYSFKKWQIISTAFLISYSTIQANSNCCKTTITVNVLLQANKQWSN